MLREPLLEQTRLRDQFWRNYVEIIRTKTIPFQYRVLDNDSSIFIDNENRIGNFQDNRSNALENLRITAGWSRGERYGTIFQDSDVYKWLESVAYSLEIHPDGDLQKLADAVVDLIGAAQQKDGYLHSYFTLQEPKMRYRMMYYGHEHYCMGHLLEALTAYHQVTENAKALNIAEKIVTHLDETFGYGEGQIQGADGHQEVEIGLLRYYEMTRDPRALRLASFFLDVRGKDPDFYTKQMEKNQEEGLSMRYASVAGDVQYLQAHKQPKDQRTAEGHAVRMLYMAAAMARLVRHNQDSEMYEACRAIWENITRKKMYITAGVGSAVKGEAFTGDYDLPNDSMYCETCASIALVYFAYEMFKLDPKAEYMDVIERALYNGILAGASTDGVHFFYVNPLEVHADLAETNPGLGHVKHIRPEWYSCACCPPNFARTIGSMQRYIYTCDPEDDSLYVNLLVASEWEDEDGRKLVQSRSESYRTLQMILPEGKKANLKVRIPYWAKDVRLLVDGEEISVSLQNGYQTIICDKAETVVELHFREKRMVVTANPAVAADANRLAVQWGPLVYCAEQVDNEFPISEYVVTPEEIRSGESRGEEAGGPVLVIHSKAALRETDSLYRFDEERSLEDADLVMIPYYQWANRGSRDMMVWLHRRV